MKNLHQRFEGFDKIEGSISDHWLEECFVSIFSSIYGLYLYFVVFTAMIAVILLLYK